MLLGIPDITPSHPGIDKLGAGCRVDPSVSVMRFSEREDVLCLADDVSLYGQIRIVLGDVQADPHVGVRIGARTIVNVGSYLSGEGGLEIGAGLEDLGKGLRSQIGTMYGTMKKGVRYLEMAEGYVLKIGLDQDKEVIGYQFVNLGKMMDAIKKGVDPKEAYEKNIGSYGRFAEAAEVIDPRHQ